MKRFGEKAAKEALENGAIIRDYNWYTGIGSPRIIVNGEAVGYIVSDLLYKLIREGYAEKTRSEHSFREYTASAWALELAAERNPFGLAACVQQLTEERDALGWDAAKIASVLLRSEEVNGAFFNRRMWDAFDVVFPGFRVPRDVVRDIWSNCTEDDRYDAAEHAARNIRAYQETIEAEEAQEEPQPEPVEEPQPEPKQYAKADGSEGTRSASEALRWINSGADVIVCGGGRPAVYVHGRKPEPEPARDENWEHCRRISDTLDAYADGEVRRCPSCGEEIQRDWGDVGDAFRCPSCGDVRSLDDWDWLGLYDYFDDCYDLEFCVGSDKEFRSARIMIACGGPNIYIDTGSGCVELYWWGESARYHLRSDTREAVNDWALEYWDCM